MNKISQILTLLMLIKVAISLNNKTLILNIAASEEILAEPREQRSEVVVKENFKVNLTNITLETEISETKEISSEKTDLESETLSEETTTNTSVETEKILNKTNGEQIQNSEVNLTIIKLLQETLETEEISTKNIKVQSENLSEEVTTNNSTESLDITTQSAKIEEATTKSPESPPNDAVIEYLTGKTRLQTESISQENSTLQPIIILENKLLSPQVSADLQITLLSEEQENSTILPVIIIEQKLSQEVSNDLPTNSLSEAQENSTKQGIQILENNLTSPEISNDLKTNSLSEEQEISTLKRTIIFKNKLLSKEVLNDFQTNSLSEEKENSTIKPIIILENKLLSQEISNDLPTNSLSEELTNNFIKEKTGFEETTTIKPINISETTKLIKEISLESAELQKNSFSDENNIEYLKSEPLVKEITTKPLISLEDYAVKQLNFILDHMLIASQEFVYKVLQATGNSKFQRDDLKRYAENLDFLLNPEDYYSEEVEDGEETEEIKVRQKQPEDIYVGVLRKLSFIKGKSTKELQSHLPQEWVKAYKTNKQEVSIWLDKAAEKMREEFNRYVSEDEDNLKYQYFNESFDDITRANEIHQKLLIIADLIKIVKNQKQISFMDLYMH